MAKRLVIDYGTDTLIDLDAPRQNLGQRYNLGGLESSDNPKLLTKQNPQYGSSNTYGESFFEEEMPNTPDLLREEGIKIGEQVKNDNIYPWGYDKNPPWAYIPKDPFDPGIHERFLEDFDVRNETMHADGGLVRQNYDKAGAVKQAIETDWPKIVKKWNEIFPPKAVESKDADFISLKEFNEPKIPGSGISIDDIMGNLATLAPRPVGKTGQTISDIKMLGRGAEWPDLSQVIIKDKISLDLEPEVLLQELKRTKGNLLDPRWWNGVKQYQLLTGKKFKEIKKDLGYHGDTKTLNDAVKKLNLVDTFDFKVGGQFGTFADLPFGNTSMTEITKKGGSGLDDTYTRIEELEIDPAKTMVNETDLKKILGLEQKSGLADNHYQGVKTEGAGQNKKVLLGDVLNNIKKTIERKAALADPGRINKIRKETSKAVEGLMGDISKSFLGLKEPVTLGKAIKAEHIPSRIKNIFKKYELGDIELAHKFPLHFFGQGKHTPKIKWIREHKDLLVKPDTYSWQSRDVNQGILKTAQNKLVKPYKALQPYFDKYKAGDKISKKDAGAITEINNKIIKTKKGIDDQVTEFLKARPKDVSGRMFQNQGGIDVAIFDLATAQPKLLNEGKSLWGKSAEDMTSEELLYMKTNLKQDWANIASQKISAPHDKKTFETFVMSDWFSPSKVGTESRYKSGPRAYADGGPVIPRVEYREGTRMSPAKPKEKTYEELLREIQMEYNIPTDEGYMVKNKLGRFGDAVDVRNYPYYGSKALKGIMNATEFSIRFPGAAGQFIHDVATGPGWKEQGLDFIENVSPGWGWSEKVGLDSLIDEQVGNMKKRGSSDAPTSLGGLVELGTDIAMPLGYLYGAKRVGQFMNTMAKTPEKVSALNKRIMDHLDASGQSRRDFITMAGTMGTFAALKAMGLDKVLKISPVTKATDGLIPMVKGTSQMPEWFPLFIQKIQPKLIYEGDGISTFKGTDDFLPGMEITKRGDDYTIMGDNAYGGQWNVSYEGPRWLEIEPGQKPTYFSGEFQVVDDAPRMVDPDGGVDWDMVTHDTIDDILGGNGRSMEEFAKGTKIEGLTKGEKQVDWAEGRVQSELDQARELEPEEWYGNYIDDRMPDDY